MRPSGATRMMRVRFDCVSEIKRGDGMARGRRRAGAGRKASGKVAMLVRVSPKVRGAIEREAQRTGRSLSAQAEAILLEAALERSRGERKSRALAYLITQAGKVMEAAALAIATLDKARAHELAAWRNAPIGSPFYGLPQVAEETATESINVRLAEDCRFVGKVEHAGDLGGGCASRNEVFGSEYDRRQATRL